LMQIGAMSAMIFVPYGGAGYGIYQGMNLAIPLNFLRLQRDAEFDADYFAVLYVYKSGYDPQCFLDFVQRIWEPGNTRQKPPDIPKAFSTYPPLPERIQALQKEIAEILPERDNAIVSTSAFQEFQDRLQSLPPSPSTPKPELRHRSCSNFRPLTSNLCLL